MGRKLDLSKLTDEEAKHVWEVIQRDINLRKKEEERLEDLKGKLEKESTKRELLSAQSHLNETHCIHCLQPFKFLVNSKRQCLDCHLHTCKSCSSFNKKEQGWVCDPCRLSRVVKTGSLEWYYEHVRSRFKRFGSAKVMRSLYGRMAPSGQKTKPSSLGLRDRVYSLPDINNDCHLYNEEEEDSGADEANDVLDSAEAERCARTFEEFPGAEEEATEKESMVAEADLASMFHHILQEQGQKTSAPEQEFTTEVRFTVNSHTKNLERISKAGNPWNEQQPSQYSGDMDTSDEDVKGAHKSLAYPPHHTKRRSRASSQENLNHSGSQPEGSDSHTDPSVEEKELKRKLEQLARNISDKGISSDEDEEEKKTEQHKQVMSSSSDDQPTGTKKVYFLPEKTYELEKKLRALDHTRHSITTDSELSELEDKVASAMADVQHTESEVSDIETRIAALSAAGLTVKPVEKSKKKSSSQVFTLQPTRNSYNSPDDQSSDSPVTASSDDFKVMAMPHVLRRKFTSSLEISNNAESFARNSYYRGSLTQRNPNGRNRKADRIFSKPVMTHRS